MKWPLIIMGLAGLAAGVAFFLKGFHPNSPNTVKEPPMTQTYTPVGTNQSITVIVNPEQNRNVATVWSQLKQNLDAIPAAHFVGITSLDSRQWSQQVGENVYDHLSDAAKAEWDRVMRFEPVLAGRFKFATVYSDWLGGSETKIQAKSDLAFGPQKDAREIQAWLFMASQFITGQTNGTANALFYQLSVAQEVVFRRTSTTLTLGTFSYQLTASGNQIIGYQGQRLDFPIDIPQILLNALPLAAGNFSVKDAFSQTATGALTLVGNSANGSAWRYTGQSPEDYGSVFSSQGQRNGDAATLYAAFGSQNMTAGEAEQLGASNHTADQR